jgi:hypothetical protein
MSSYNLANPRSEAILIGSQQARALHKNIFNE